MDTLPLLLQAPDAVIDHLLEPLRGKSPSEEAIAVADWLARTGHPLVGQVLDERWARKDERIRHERNRWRQVRERLDVLASLWPR